jgi:hypothetical protein
MILKAQNKIPRWATISRCGPEAPGQCTSRKRDDLVDAWGFIGHMIECSACDATGTLDSDAEQCAGCLGYGWLNSSSIGESIDYS